MDLALLKAELSRRSERYAWLRHAFVLRRSNHDWHDMHVNWLRAINNGLCDAGRRRVANWMHDYPDGKTPGYSVMLADANCTDFEAKDAIRQFRSLVQPLRGKVKMKTKRAKLIYIDGGGIGSERYVTEEASNYPDLWLEHLHATLEPAVRRHGYFADDESAVELDIYELHCDVFAATLACLPVSAKHSLSIEIATLMAVLDGERIALKSEPVARWLALLNSPPGQWVSGPDAIKRDGKLDGHRTNKLREQCPTEIAKLLETSNKYGCRLNLC